ncbi:MAG: PGF-pre-PGF domain-containing protein [Candidatus Nanoarchaeia archaeon]|nr:PGF-pre-PGF domain-containing protein [Candidatus Nanoarchaeia archaeon]
MRKQRLHIYLISLILILSALITAQISNNQDFSTGYIATGTSGTVLSRTGSDLYGGEGKVISYEKRLRGLRAGQLYEIEVIKQGPQRQIPFSAVSFTVSKDRREGIISFKKPTQLPTSAQAPPLSRVYSYGQITVESPIEASDGLTYTDIDTSIVEFEIEKKFLEFQDSSPDLVDIYILSAGSWQKVSSSRGEDTTFTYIYTAQVPFGIFAVTYNIITEEEFVPSGPICGNGLIEAGENCAVCPADVQCSPGQTCQAGVCITPPQQVRQEQPIQQQVAPPPTVRQPQKGSSLWIWIILTGILIMVILILMIVFRKHKGSEGEFGFTEQGMQPVQSAVPGQPMQPQMPAQATPPQQIQQPINNQQPEDPKLKQIKDYISSVMQKGFKKEQIKSTLVSKGWPADLVDKAFATLGK